LKELGTLEQLPGNAVTSGIDSCSSNGSATAPVIDKGPIDLYPQQHSPSGSTKPEPMPQTNNDSSPIIRQNMQGKEKDGKRFISIVDDDSSDEGNSFG
jgi:hypothetical protein